MTQEYAINKAEVRFLEENKQPGKDAVQMRVQKSIAPGLSEAHCLERLGE